MTQVFSLPFQDRATHPLAGVTVLQLIPDLETNATARAAIDIAAALGAAGARALVACADGWMKGELQAKGCVFVPFPSHTKNPLAMALNTRRLAHLIAAESADIVHVRSRALAWVALGATRMTKTPLVTSFHSGCQGSNPITMRYNSVLARGDAVLADTRFMADLAGRLCAPAAEKTRVIHQGIDCRIFSPDMVTPDRVQAVRRHWKVAPHEQIVLLAASSHATGHKILIEAARLLSRSGLTGVKFILACERKEGALDRAIDRAIAREGLQGIMYRAPHSDTPAAYLTASIVVVPTAGAQASNDAAVQAQAMGTPVIVANAGAAPETVLAIANVLSLGASASGKLSSRARKQNAFFHRAILYRNPRCVCGAAARRRRSRDLPPAGGGPGATSAGFLFANSHAIPSLTSRRNIDFMPQSTDVPLGSGNRHEDRRSDSRACRVRFVHTRRISHSPSYESRSRSAKGRAAHKP